MLEVTIEEVKDYSFKGFVWADSLNHDQRQFFGLTTTGNVQIDLYGHFNPVPIDGGQSWVIDVTAVLLGSPEHSLLTNVRDLCMDALKDDIMLMGSPNMWATDHADAIAETQGGER